MASELDRFSLDRESCARAGRVRRNWAAHLCGVRPLGAKVALISRSADHGREARDVIRREAGSEADIVVGGG